MANVNVNKLISEVISKPNLLYVASTYNKFKFLLINILTIGQSVINIPADKIVTL